MKTDKYNKILNEYSQAKKKYEKMITELSKDVKNKSGYKLKYLADKLEITPETLRYKFKSGIMDEKMAKKLLKILAEI